MTTVRVRFTDWNDEAHTVDVTEQMTVGLRTNVEERAVLCAMRYIKRRYTECVRITAVELVQLRKDAADAPIGAEA